MSRHKPVRTDPGDRGLRATRALGAALTVLMALSGTACSSGSTAQPSATARPSSASVSTTLTSSTNPTNTVGPTIPGRTTTRLAQPAARCPAIRAVATPQVPLECTSATVLGAAAARVGLHRDQDGPTLLPILYLLSYSHTGFLPRGYRREINTFHYINGAVASLLCSGVVAATLDPVLGVCLDVGPSTRTDRPAVRSWALRAEATIAKSVKAQPVLRSGTLTFVACSDPSFPKTSNPDMAFEMNVYIVHSGAPVARGDCSR